MFEKKHSFIQMLAFIKMKKSKYIPIIIIGLLYVAKIIPLLIELHNRIVAFHDPGRYLSSIWIVLKQGMLTESLVLFAGLIGLFIRNIIGYILTLLFPLYVIGYLLITWTAISDSWLYLIFASIILTTLSIPVTLQYYKISKKEYYIGIGVALLIGVILSFLGK